MTDKLVRFRRRPELVTARRLTTFEVVRIVPKHHVEVDESGEFLVAQPGEWITADDDGHESVWSDAEFQRHFEAAE